MASTESALFPSQADVCSKQGSGLEAFCRWRRALCCPFAELGSLFPCFLLPLPLAPSRFSPCMVKLAVHGDTQVTQGDLRWSRQGRALLFPAGSETKPFLSQGSPISPPQIRVGKLLLCRYWAACLWALLHAHYSVRSPDHKGYLGMED